MVMSYGDMIDEKMTSDNFNHFLSSVDYNNTWWGKPLHEDGSEWSYWELLEVWEECAS